ncbi:hypothetical protein GBA52_006353 [Prunus armeniaca]|nr:hypothetical protein GBA52_006353 [Prunus armeniaca]
MQAGLGLVGFGAFGVSSSKREPGQEVGASRLGWPSVGFEVVVVMKGELVIVVVVVVRMAVVKVMVDVEVLEEVVVVVVVEVEADEAVV